MEQLALAVLSGVMAGLWLRVPGELLLLAIALTGIAVFLRRCPPACAGFVLAWSWAALNAYDYQNSLPGHELHDADLLVSGCVVSFPRHGPNGISFLFRGGEADAARGLLFLRVFPARTPGSASLPLEPQAGACYDLMLRLKPPHGQSNPGQFDRQRWLMAQRVQATGYVRNSKLNRHRPDLRAADLTLYTRAAVRQRIRAAIPEHPATPMIEGLAVGVRSAIDSSDWDVFRATGTVHLMAISGLHVGLVAGGVWWLVSRLCGRLVMPGRLRWPAFAAAVVAAIGYAMLAGWSAPTQRAALMFVALLIVLVRYRVSRPGGLLAASMLVVLLTDPFVLLQPGFWMSYLAVALLITLPVASRVPGSSPSRRLQRSLLAGTALVRAQWRLTLGLTVPNMLLFDAWAILGPVVNLIAIPLFSFLLLPLTLVSVALLWLLPEAGSLLILPVADALGWAIDLLRTAADVSWAQPERLNDHRPLQFGLGAISLLALLPRPLRNVPLLTVAPAAIAGAILLLPRPLFSVEVLDVGQGTAVLIRSSGRSLLVDAGPAWPGGDAAAAVILPFLRHAGVAVLDVVAISHADNDHSGGLMSLLDGIPVAAVLLPEPAAASDHWRCQRGMGWRWGEATVEVLHPHAVAGWSRNNASCVLRVRFRGISVLLPGDIETAAEAVLTARYPDLRSNLIIAPHHGSNTSSAEQLVAAVKPDFVVYTTAYWNRWGFPKSTVVARWRSVGACGLDLPDTGALRFEWREGKGLQLAAARKYHWSRPWPIRPVSDDYCL